MKLVLLAFATALLSAPALAQPTVVTREVGTLVTENVPETPPEVRERLRRYQNARSAGFRDWLADGSMLITTRFGQTNQLHRVTAPLGVRSQLTFFDEPVAGAVAQPGAPGRYIFSRDAGGDEYFQAYAADLAGAEVQITEPKTRNLSLVFSKDGRRLAWSRVTPGSGDYDILLMEASDPATRRVAHEGTGAMSPIAFSPDGSKLLLNRYISVQSSKRFVLDLASGALTEINPSETEIAYTDGEFTADGRAVLMISDEGSEFARLVRYDLADGRRTTIAEGRGWDIESFDLSEDGRLLAYSANEDGRSRVTLSPFGGGADLVQPQLPTGVLTALRFSPDGQRLAIGLNTATSPADVWVWDLAQARLTRWTESELGGLNRAAMVEPSLIRFRSFDKRQIPAWVYRPKAPAGGKAPVIVSIHGGPEGQERPGFNPTYQYWVNELGAAVVVPNVRGSTGYGKTYVALDNREKRQDSVKDIGALLDWIATQPDLDASRVVVTGGSYGGFMTLASLAAYNDRIAGAMESVGISDFETFLKNTEGYRRDLRRAEYGDERDPKMQALFRKISPIHLTDRMSRPLFVVAGYNDPRVPWTEGQQIVRKVRENGGEVWWMMAKDEGHGFAKKHNRDALREAETLFLKKVFRLP
ncbi:S9 family peptidase [Phenylobacterium sp.]|jgi:dipeptidyl aminopeptidase/acylaminoacyl peptidase|uniref:S9 family peptidase n=1 Tax=Phenylobacterium sp. TaxID=1871053 RepID=UPI002E38214C|nr:prolyl oligopeptidase family serine peptidase [Phenylobacterium sp.]HEX2562097.1 prolyl oligopeptidase family serine peptidase [Phenylobacterium sp.]